MTLEREFYGFRMASGKLVSLWRALEFFNPEADTGDHRHEAKAYNYDGWVEQCWSDQTTRWLVFEIHEVFHLKSGNGNLHMWSVTLHALPPPVYTVDAIANAVMPENMSPEEWLRSSGFRDPDAMRRELRSPHVLARRGSRFVEVMHQILDRMQGAMAELRVQEQDLHGN